MKKTYKSPKIMMVNLNMNCHLMNQSFHMTGDSASVNDSGDYNTLSRGSSSLWDDDDEE